MLRKVRKDSSQSELRVITEPDNRLGSYKRVGIRRCRAHSLSALSFVPI